MVKKNTCIFISGYGSNLQTLIKKSRDYNFPAKIKLVISNNLNAKGIFHAKKNSIPYYIVNTQKRNYDYELLKEIKKYKISLICSAGYMKIIPDRFIKNFRKKIINVHPSLLPKYKGLKTYERVIKNKDIVTGCTIHYVSKNLDSGQIILQKKFFVKKDDDISVLKHKTQNLERKAFFESIIQIFRYT